MNNKENQPSVERILNNLLTLSADFNTAAERNKRIATTLQFAADMLRDEQKKNRELQNQVRLLEGAVAQQKLKLKGKKLTFYIDGSGSMTNQTALYQGGNNAHNGKSPLRISLESISDFSQLTGVDASFVFWGDTATKPARQLKGMDIRALENSAPIYGTDFAPALDNMQSLLSASKQKAQHFVVVSDGDFFDEKQASPSAVAFLMANPKTTVDFVLLTTQNHTPMSEFVAKLQQQFPAQVGFEQVNNQIAFDAALTNIAIRRMPSAKPSAPKNNR